MKANRCDSVFNLAERVNDEWVCEQQHAGRFSFYVDQKIPNKKAGMLFVCPGCCHLAALAFVKIDLHAVWMFDGNEAEPSLTPSVVHAKELGGCGWHGFLEQGFWKPCS